MSTTSLIVFALIWLGLCLGGAYFFAMRKMNKSLGSKEAKKAG